MTKVQPYWDRGCEIYDEVEPYVEKAVDKAQVGAGLCCLEPPVPALHSVLLWA